MMRMEREQETDDRIVAGFMRQAAATADKRIPDAGLVWWKMQLRARREAAERAARPVLLAERAAAAAALIGAGWAAISFSVDSPAIAAAGIAGLAVIVLAAGSALWFAWSRK